MSQSKDFLKFAINSIRHRKLRSWLTILGIIIGVASIVALLSISAGMENAIEDQFENFGTDTINVMPRNFQGPGTGTAIFDDSDVNEIKSLPELEHVLPAITGAVEVEFHNQKAYTNIMGVDLSNDAARIWKKSGFEAEDGRFPKDAESSTVGLGYLAARDLFDDEVHVNNRILINGKKFKVVGIAKEIGNQIDDMTLYMSLDPAKEILDQTDYNFIMVIAKEGVDVDATADKIKTRLERHRDDENFQVMTLSEVLDTIGQILGIIQLVLAGIAAISLLVGAIGIMNTMYTSVLERTKEIGIMKSIGATNNTILGLFLVESGLIGLVGGILGAAIGGGIALGVGYIASNMALPVPLKIIIEPWLVGAAIGFAVVMGMISGFLPAREAAKKNPVDSLRYE